MATKKVRTKRKTARRTTTSRRRGKTINWRKDVMPGLKRLEASAKQLQIEIKDFRKKQKGYKHVLKP